MGAARISGFGMAFDKIGQDGSGKATLFDAPGQAVHGALFHLDDPDLARLDEIEGLGRGYDRLTVRAEHDGQVMPAAAYLAPAHHRHAALTPFDWYLGLVLAGACEQALPDEWTAQLRAVTAVPDPDAARPRQIEAWALLNACPRGWRLS